MSPDLLPSTDNFFKYILTIGFVCLVFAFIYPIQNQNKLEVEKITLLEAMAIDSVDHRALEKQFDELKQLRDQITDSINKLNALGKNAPVGSKQKVDSFRAAFFTSKNQFHSKAIEINKQTLKTDYAKQRYLTLDTQVHSFKTIKNIGIIVGVILMAFGLLFWAGSSYHDELTKAKNDPPQTIYTQYFDRLNKWPKFMTFLFVIIIILLIKVLLSSC